MFIRSTNIQQRRTNQSICWTRFKSKSRWWSQSKLFVTTLHQSKTRWFSLYQRWNGNNKRKTNSCLLWEKSFSVPLKRWPNFCTENTIQISKNYMSSIVAIRTNTMEVIYRSQKTSSLGHKFTMNIFDRQFKPKIHRNELFLYFIVNFHRNARPRCKFSIEIFFSSIIFDLIFSLRYMRSEDRNIHAANYPALHYPEIYLLEGGYKAFFEYSTVNHRI